MKKLLFLLTLIPLLIFGQTDEDKMNLKSALAEATKNCPIVIDEKTTMVSMAYMDKLNVVEYQFTFDGVFADNFNTIKKRELVNKWKTSPEQSKLINYYKFKVNYFYQNLSGEFLTKIVINYDDVKLENSNKEKPKNETSDNSISDPNEIIFKKTLYETMIENGYSHEEADSRSTLGAVKMKLDFEKSSTYYSSGLNKISSKDYYGAIADFTESIDLFLFNPQSFTSRGRAKHKLGDYNGAIEDLNTAISQDSDYDEAYFRRSFSKMALKNYIGAVADLNKLILLNNEYPKCYYWLGMAKFQLEDYLGASDALSLAIKRDPSNPDLYFNRANFNAMCKRPFCNDFKSSCDYGHERACEMYYKMCK